VTRAMRTSFGIVVALTGIAGLALLAGRPALVGAGAGGTVEAFVTYAGAPAVEKIAVNKDTEKCGTEAVIQKVAVGANKGLANAVVSVVGATGEAATKTKASIEQKGCEFSPHVVAMMPGELEIRNSDDILHNVHTYSTANPPINKAQPKFKKTMVERFDKPELIKLTCDVHSWMLAWIVVMPHPFFGVTDGAGVAKIENVPAGRHTLEVWHEALGTAAAELEVKAGRVSRVIIEMTKRAGP